MVFRLSYDELIPSNVFKKPFGSCVELNQLLGRAVELLDKLIHFSGKPYLSRDLTKTLL